MSLLMRIIAAVLIVSWAAAAHAGEKAGRKPAGDAGAGQGRTTVEFDEKVIEGMSAKDLSAARHTGENRGRKGASLIREKTDFKDEMRRSLKEVPWVQ